MRRFTFKQYAKEYIGEYSNKIILDTSEWEPFLWDNTKEPDTEYKRKCLDFLLKYQTFINSSDFSEDDIEEFISVQKEIISPYEDLDPSYKEDYYSLLINLKKLFFLIKEKEKIYMRNKISDLESLDYDNFKELIKNIMLDNYCVSDKLHSETLLEDSGDTDGNFYGLIEVLEFFAENMSISEFKEEIMPMVNTVLEKDSDYYGEYYEAKSFQEISLKKLHQKLLDLNYIKKTELNQEPKF